MYPSQSDAGLCAPYPQKSPPWICRKSSKTTQKSSKFPQKRPLYLCQKSRKSPQQGPIYLQKSPTYPQKSPFPQKSQVS